MRQRCPEVDGSMPMKAYCIVDSSGQVLQDHAFSTRDRAERNVRDDDLSEAGATNQSAIANIIYNIGPLPPADTCTEGDLVARSSQESRPH